MRTEVEQNLMIREDTLPASERGNVISNRSMPVCAGAGRLACQC